MVYTLPHAIFLHLRVLLLLLLIQSSPVLLSVVAAAANNPPAAAPVHNKHTTTSSSYTSSPPAPGSGSGSGASASPSLAPAPRNVTLLQVQIVHRHGDRTPITPLRDEEYWRRTLPREDVLRRVAFGTRLKRDDDDHDGEDGQEGFRHPAAGRGPFGQLTNLGLLQMVELGSQLREELVRDHQDDVEGGLEEWGGSGDIAGDGRGVGSLRPGGSSIGGGSKLFCSKNNPLLPHRIKVRSTDFPRTIDSVRGLLVGLFPDGIPTEEHGEVEVDVRRTKYYIPDPQPRNSVEQTELERRLVSRRHVVKREEEMRHLAIRATEALGHLVSPRAGEVAFGVGEDDDDDGGGGTKADGDGGAVIDPLPWNQLAEICKCLRVRNMLPPGITEEDEEAMSSHAAWRWFENMRHPRLARLAMHHMVRDLLRNVEEGQDCPRTGGVDDAPLLHIYSAHDSTLIGLLCAFHLEQPAEWPEYGSYLKMELLAVELDSSSEEEGGGGVGDGDGEMQGTSRADGGSTTTTAKSSVRHYVRFSLNGTLLRCHWGKTDDDDTPLDMVPVEVLKGLLHATEDHREGDDEDAIDEAELKTIL